MTQLYEIKVKLSPGQKKSITDAYKKKETVVLRLANDSLSGSDILYVPHNIVKRLDKKRKLKQGIDIQLSKSNIRKQVGGSLLSLWEVDLLQQLLKHLVYQLLEGLLVKVLVN